MINQATAYQGIQERKHRELRHDVTANLQAAEMAVERISGSKETDATIWNDLRKPVLTLRA